MLRCHYRPGDDYREQGMGELTLESVSDRVLRVAANSKRLVEGFTRVVDRGGPGSESPKGTN